MAPSSVPTTNRCSWSCTRMWANPRFHTGVHKHMPLVMHAHVTKPQISRGWTQTHDPGPACTWGQTLEFMQVFCPYHKHVLSVLHAHVANPSILRGSAPETLDDVLRWAKVEFRVCVNSLSLEDSMFPMPRHFLARQHPLGCSPV
jgi:hypothetical protein